MSNETYMTVVGNLTEDPDLRILPSGVSVAQFTVASTPRTLNRDTDEWQDGEPLFMRCKVWRDYAQNVATLSKGTRVIVYGRVQRRVFDTDDGERSVIELDVEEVGPALRFHTATVHRATRDGSKARAVSRDTADDGDGQDSDDAPAPAPSGTGQRRPGRAASTRAAGRAAGSRRATA